MLRDDCRFWKCIDSKDGACVEMVFGCGRLFGYGRLFGWR